MLIRGPVPGIAKGIAAGASDGPLTRLCNTGALLTFTTLCCRGAETTGFRGANVTALGRAVARGGHVLQSPGWGGTVWLQKRDRFGLQLWR